MGEENLSKDLILRIRSIVAGYVKQKTEAKSETKIDLEEVRKRVCEGAFLRLRSCKSRRDFINFFTGTICSVPHYIPKDDFERLSNALLEGETWMDVKAVAMMTLSSMSIV